MNGILSNNEPDKKINFHFSLIGGIFQCLEFPGNKSNLVSSVGAPQLLLQGIQGCHSSERDENVV